MKKKMIIYQMFTRLFGNTTENVVPDGDLSGNGVGKLNDITAEALKSIRSLGSTHVWFTGVIEHATATDYSLYGIDKDNPYIVKGKAGSPYAIKDYYDIDPDLAVNVPGRMKEFEALVQRTHQQGLGVIIDFVPNHVARHYVSDAKPAGVKDLGEDDDTSVHFSARNNFYYIPRQELVPQFYVGEGKNAYHEYPAKATGNDCFGAYPCKNDWYDTVKLNYGVDYMHGRHRVFDPIPDTWIKMLDILLFWSGKGVDAFRCDMAEMVPVQFWGWAIPKVKKQYPGILFIAEIYNQGEYRNYIHNGKFDYLYDKVGLYDTLKAVLCHNASASLLTQCWQSVDGINHSMLNFLENHEEQRFASPFFAGDAGKVLPALVVSAMISVCPFMIYFGQELGERGMDAEGFSGEDGRTTIFDYWTVPTIARWNNKGKFNSAKLTAGEKKLRKLYQKVLLLCNKEDAISEGSFFDLMYVNYDNPDFNAHRQFAFLRRGKKTLLVIVVNFSSRPVSVKVNIPAHAFSVMALQEGIFKCEELLSGDEDTKKIYPDMPFETRVDAYGAVVWKAVQKNIGVEIKK